MVPLSFAQRDFIATADGALFDPRRGALIVADLHLEKASWFARFGQLLPPYDSLATLTGLWQLIERLDVRELWCLGDNFHDADGTARINGAARALLEAIGRRVRLNWVVGNHDPVLAHRFGGAVFEEAMLDGIALRHIADPDRPGFEMSGHFHPKLRVAVHRRRVSRPCFVRTHERLILPAYGALTGGMDVYDRAIRARIGSGGAALVVSRHRLLEFPDAVTETA